MYCKICNKEVKSWGSLSKHIRDNHNLKSQEYYDKFLKQNNDGLCVICNNKTKWMNLNIGYSTTCSHKCGGILHRKKLKTNKEKFEKFRKKTSDVHTKIWQEKELSGEKEQIMKKINKKKNKTISKWSDKKKKEKFGWLNKLTKQEKDYFIKNKMFTTGYHKWWKEASDEEKQKVVNKRMETNHKKHGWFNSNDKEVIKQYFRYRQKVSTLTERTYKKYKNIINPNNYSRSKTKYQLDHKYSVSAGFKDQIQPEIIASVYNLQMLTAIENNKKNNNCSITKEKLLELYEKKEI